MEIKVQCKLEKLPSRVLVDLNVHSVRHPNKSEFSHCSGRGKTISGEPNALGMVTSYLLEEVGDGLDGGRLVDAHLVAAHDEALLVREPVLQEVPQPQLIFTS